jgi:hypothetical protein
MDPLEIEKELARIALGYTQSFSEKTYAKETDTSDPLMDAFGITADLKRENRQYWGRELSMCWQMMVVTLCRLSCKEFEPGLRVGADEPCDLRLAKDAIDTKYRVGSGDSGTLKKFKAYGELLSMEGYQPVLLFVRSDNLPAAMAACAQGGWKVYLGKESFRYLLEKTGFNLEVWLNKVTQTGELRIRRAAGNV